MFWHLLTFCAFAAIHSDTASAANSIWNQPAFGVYSFDANWIGGAPNETRRAFFGASNVTTVAPEDVLFVVNGDASTAVVASGEYEFQFGNAGLTVNMGALEIGVGDSTLDLFGVGGPLSRSHLPNDAKLTIDVNPYGYAGTITVNSVTIGSSVDADESPRPGTLVLTGGGTRLEALDRAYIGAGGSTGRLEILDGATMLVGNECFFGFGRDNGVGSPELGDGTMLVSGAGSAVDAQGGMYLHGGVADVSAGGAIQSSFLSLSTPSENDDNIAHLTISGSSIDSLGAPHASHVAAARVSFDDLSVIEVLRDNAYSAYMVIGDEAASASPEKHINGGVYLDASGQLTGSGTIIGKLVIGPGASYSPGNSPGVVHVDGDFESLAGATLSMEIGRFAHDQLDVTGNLTLAGDVKVHLWNGFLPQVGDTFDLFRVGGDFDASTAQFKWHNAPTGLQYDTSFANGTYSLRVTAVPEPSTLALATLGAIGILVARRRKTPIGTRHVVRGSLSVLLLLQLVLSSVGSSQAVDVFSAGMEVPETISLIPDEFGVHGGNYLVPDPGFAPRTENTLWVVPSNGGAPIPFATIPNGLGASSAVGGLFLPLGFGDRGGMYLTGFIDTAVTDFSQPVAQTDWVNRIVTVDGAGTVSDFVLFEYHGLAQDFPDGDLSSTRFKVPSIAPAGFGSVGGQVLYSAGAPGHSGVLALDPAGSITSFFDAENYGTQHGTQFSPFGVTFSTDNFGAWGTRLFVSDDTQGTDGQLDILAIDGNGSAEVFASVHGMTSATVGLRQLAFVPDGFDDLTGKLLVSVSGSRSGGSALGQLLAFDADGELYKTLRLGTEFDKFDPRGMFFTDDGRILISDASDPILVATAADFAPVPEPSAIALSLAGLTGLIAFGNYRKRSIQRTTC